MFKFGIVRVQNLSRNLKARRLSEGVATNLKADIQFMFLGAYTDKGDFSQYNKKFMSWSARMPLKWHHEGWDDPLRPVEDGEKLKQSIEEMKRVAQYPLILGDRYLTEKGKDILQVGDEAFIRVFYTQGENRVWFLPSERASMLLGKYKFKIRVSAYERKPRTRFYELDIKGWNEFKTTEVEE